MRLTAEMFDQIVGGLKSDTTTGKDKRREPRVGMAAEADLVTVGDDGKRIAGKIRIRDLSASGIGLTFTQALSKNQRFVLQLETVQHEPVWLVCLTAYCKRASSGFSIGARVKQVLRAEQIAKVESQPAAARLVPVAAPAAAADESDIARISRAILG